MQSRKRPKPNQPQLRRLHQRQLQSRFKLKILTTTIIKWNKITQIKITDTMIRRTRTSRINVQPIIIQTKIITMWRLNHMIMVRTEITSATTRSLTRRTSAMAVSITAMISNATSSIRRTKRRARRNAVKIGGTKRRIQFRNARTSRYQKPLFTRSVWVLLILRRRSTVNQLKSSRSSLWWGSWSTKTNPLIRTRLKS